MEYKELKDIVEKLAISQAEESKKIKELRIFQAETSEQIKELRIFQEKTIEENKEFRKEQSRLSKKWDSFLGNYGEVAEEYFYRSLEKTKELGKLKFDSIERNIRKTDNSVEFDIILINGNSIAIVEVKSKAHPKDIKPLIEKKIKHFKLDYPEYDNYTYYFGIATMITNKAMIEEAEKEGIFLLTQNADHLEIVNDKVNTF